ncbi:uncharacterized protein B0H18DRAFT_342427 [Fomitopsis serialis]|uniref:uncharacterized protein n=1 Tax=Fomitopsis serialis TaxID=139415 RepID=UPI0020086697|nr:uncharacterized protein B0H18DRAFT_342427 [Neoantrodia serialis]KAH9926449.1 hypothetical protein B0H18DRAFT_342427 [Neoantrodia serialis]
MNLLTLDEDSLSAIVAHLSCDDALRLSLVARSIHTIAKHHALKHVTIYTYDGLVKFCWYMLNDMRHRLSCIVSFIGELWILNDAEMDESSFLGPPLVTIEEYEAAGALLAGVLERACNLRTFVLNRAEVWMEYEPRIADAVIVMRRLNELVLRDIGPMVSRVIHNMQSKPWKLAIPEIDVSSYYVHNIFPLDDGLRLPFVRHLTAYGNMALPSVAGLVRVFPNIRSLDLGNTYQVKEPPIEGILEINWPHLEHLEGMPETLAKWRNMTPIHSVRLWRDFDARYHRNPRLLEGVRSAQPVALAISFGSAADAGYWNDIVSVSSKLRYLRVDVCSTRYSRSWQQDLETSFAKIIPTLAKSTIICLEILCCLPERTEKNENDNMSDRACNDVAEHESCESICSTLPAAVASIPTLKYLSLHTYTYYGQPIDGLSEHPLTGGPIGGVTMVRASRESQCPWMRRGGGASLRICVLQHMITRRNFLIPRCCDTRCVEIWHRGQDGWYAQWDKGKLRHMGAPHSQYVRLCVCTHVVIELGCSRYTPVTKAF